VVVNRPLLAGIANIEGQLSGILKSDDRFGAP
jgi:hypothetical protein